VFNGDSEMTEPNNSRQERTTTLSARDLSMGWARRAAAAPPTDMATELRAIRILLERSFKPPTPAIQFKFSRITSIPAIGTANNAILVFDHDDDRVAVQFRVPSGAAGPVYLTDKEEPIISANDGFEIPVGSVITFFPGMCPTNRMFVAGNPVNSVLHVLVFRMDRFPRSTG
jgi:hypothetical protein